jgi:ATP-dependent DNA ligase
MTFTFEHDKSGNVISVNQTIDSGGMRPYFPLFDMSCGVYTEPSAYQRANIEGCFPMLAKEIEDEKQEEFFKLDHYYVEEKFDGTRATLHFKAPHVLAEHSSVFSKALDNFFTHGTMMSVDNVRRRIHAFFLQNKSREDRVKFLKELLAFSYGSAGAYVGFSPTNVTVRMDGAETSFVWNAVADLIDAKIVSGEFYSQDGYARVFSRRVSEKTKWFCENTDSLPQLRDLCVPSLDGTILDGEIFIPNRPFKDVSSLLNCKWDKAIERQTELGFAVFHAFDILSYKGVDTKKMPLSRRKVFLERAVKEINSPYVELVTYGETATVSIDRDSLNKVKLNQSKYPALFKETEHLQTITPVKAAPRLPMFKNKPLASKSVNLSKKAYYEYIVMNGGEGVILKPMNGRYHTGERGDDYLKVKAFLTREVIVMGYSEPTEKYEGKFPDDYWEYWCDEYGNRATFRTPMSASFLIKKGYIPVTKYYYLNQIGTIRFGVIITQEETTKLPGGKKFNFDGTIIKGHSVLEVGECSGFDEEVREYYSEHKEACIGTVIEVKANSIFPDTGKFRHPRYLRDRPDKSPLECTWSNHVGG